MDIRGPIQFLVIYFCTTSHQFFCTFFLALSLPDGYILAVPAEKEFNLFSFSSRPDVVDVPVGATDPWVERDSLWPDHLRFLTMLLETSKTRVNYLLNRHIKVIRIKLQLWSPAVGIAPKLFEKANFDRRNSLLLLLGLAFIHLVENSNLIALATVVDLVCVAHCCESIWNDPVLNMAHWWVTRRVFQFPAILHVVAGLLAVITTLINKLVK